MKLPRKLHIKSYGCQMNVYDAQRMVDTLAPEGFVETASVDDADLVILNAKVHTVDRAHPDAQALAVTGDRIRAVGSDADLVIWDPAATKTISAAKQVSRIDYNVFEGFACTGLPRATLSGGAITWLDGELRAQAGAGQYVARNPFPAVHVANATWHERTAPRRVERAAVTP